MITQLTDTDFCDVTDWLSLPVCKNITQLTDTDFSDVTEWLHNSQTQIFVMSLSVYCSCLSILASFTCKWDISYITEQPVLCGSQHLVMLQLVKPENYNLILIITARNEVGARLYFQKASVILLTGGGGAWSRGGGPWWRPPPETATAAGGTHPTGMHFC